MDQLFKELREQEKQIKKELEKETEFFTIEETKEEFERLKESFKEYSPSQEEHDQKTAFTNYNIYFTNYNFYIDKLKNLFFEEIEKEIKKAYNNILKSDEFLTDLFLNYKNILNEYQETKAKDIFTKIDNIGKILNEILEG